MPVFDPDNPKDFTVKTNPQTEQALKEAMLLPAGDYDFEVLDAVDKVSKNGNEMIALKLGVFRPNGSKQYVNDFLMEKLAFKLRHFAYAVGLGEKYEAGEMVAEDCKGRAGRVTVKIEEQDGYAPKNAVRDYVVIGKETVKPAANAKPTAPASNTDEPPF